MLNTCISCWRQADDAASDAVNRQTVTTQEMAKHEGFMTTLATEEFGVDNDDGKNRLLVYVKLKLWKWVRIQKLSVGDDMGLEAEPPQSPGASQGESAES